MSETVVKSDLAFCLGSLIEKTNSVALRSVKVKLIGRIRIEREKKPGIIGSRNTFRVYGQGGRNCFSLGLFFLFPPFNTTLNKPFY